MMRGLRWRLLVIVEALALPCLGQQFSPCYAPSGDLLGAHEMYGRGCIACHAPHNDTGGIGPTASEKTAGPQALWGRDLEPVYRPIPVLTPEDSFPGMVARRLVADAPDPMRGVLLCLSCHDGDLAENGVFKGETLESLSAEGYVPSLLETEGNTLPDAFHREHPVGPGAIIGCGGPQDWDCVVVDGQVTAPPGSKFELFQRNAYGFTVSPVVINGSPVVTCTTCHDQHGMYGWKGSIGDQGRCDIYKTRAFVRGYYDPGNPASNSTVQFCRTCHGGKSNEMHGATVPTI